MAWVAGGQREHALTFRRVLEGFARRRPARTTRGLIPDTAVRLSRLEFGPAGG